MIFFEEKIKMHEVSKEYNSDAKKYYLLTGIAWGLAILSSLRSFRFGEVTTIIPLQATAILLNVFVAYAFQNEREGRLKKILAACLVLAGVYLTVV